MTESFKKEKKKRRNKTGLQCLNAFPENCPQELFHGCCLPGVSPCLVLRAFFRLPDLLSEPGPACLRSARPVPETRPFPSLPPVWQRPHALAVGRDSGIRRGSSFFAWTVDTGAWTYSSCCEETWLQRAALYKFSGAPEFVKSTYIKWMMIHEW